MKKEKTCVYYAADTESTQPITDDLENMEGSTEEIVSKIRARARSYTTAAWAHAWSKAGDGQPVNIRQTFAEVLRDITGECVKDEQPVIYYHNLAWDGALIVSELAASGWKWVRKKKWKLNPGEYTTLIDDMGKWYAVYIQTKKALVELRDSLKLVPSKLEAIAKDFALPVEKLVGSIDYKKERALPYTPTPEEVKYIENDVKILAMMLQRLQPTDMLEHLTIGGYALAQYKSMITEKTFGNLFPLLPAELDSFIRKAYRGGWCYVSPKWEDRPLRDVAGYVLDVNSEHPYSMHTTDPRDPHGVPHMFPVGLPIYDGTPDDESVERYCSDDETTFFISLTCMFHVKHGHYPFLQFPEGHFGKTEYPTESGETPVHMVLTKIDFLHFLASYEVSCVEYDRLVVFRAAQGLFDCFIDKFIELKKSAKGKNPTEYIRAKLCLNNLYGKFGTSPLGGETIIEETPDGVKYKAIDEWDGEPLVKPTVYVPVAAVTCAFSRWTIVHAADDNFESFCYSDTDSIHTHSRPDLEKMWLDHTALGAFDVESDEHGGYKYARFVHQKCYIECYNDGYISIKAGGCPQAVKERLLYDVLPFEQITEETRRYSPEEMIERFTYGLVQSGKNAKFRVNGGNILVNTTFSIREKRH